MSEIRVLIADDHAVLRVGLKLFINSQADMVCVGEADNGKHAITQTKELQPDVLLLDIGMPELGGLEALPELVKAAPNTQILVLTMHSEDHYLRQALSLGAAGYVLKKAADQELLSAIRAVNQGEIYIHPSLTRTLLENMLPETASQQEQTAKNPLSEREEEVIQEVARGYSNQEIADRLSISIKTVETYRSRAMRKLGLNNRSELVRYALKNNWL
ncbi:response regulator transcription factor [bacterium]|nr:response regulator transcription factor [bacterium]